MEQDSRRLKVAQSCELAVQWKLVEPELAKHLKSSADTPLPVASVFFVPKDEKLGRELYDLGEDDFLLFREIGVTGLAPKFRTRTKRDHEERCAHLRAAQPVWYLRFTDGLHMVFFKNPLKFRPSEVRCGSHAEKNGRSTRKDRQKYFRSETERKRDTLVFRHIYARLDEHTSRAAQEEQHICVDFCEDYPSFLAYHERFRKTSTIDYETASRFVPGQVLNPKRPLERVYDPWFEDFPKDEGGKNALSNLEGISIPLYWPENWDHPALAGMQALRTWGERSWEAFIYFLQGKMVDSLEALLTNSCVELERLPKGAVRYGSVSDLDRRGQCYHGEYLSLTVAGPYFIFEVSCGECTVFVLDSPFYGVAMRVFRSKEFALSYAQGGAERAGVLRNSEAQLSRPIVHDPKQKWLEVWERLSASLAQAEGQLLGV